jgi:protein-disulfide isomerase
MEGKSAIYDLEISKKQAPVSDAERVEALVKAGIDRVELEKCLETDRYLDQVDNDVQLGESRRVNGTPTVFLDGKRIDNAFFRDPDTFKMNLERILSPQ